MEDMKRIKYKEIDRLRKENNEIKHHLVDILQDYLSEVLFDGEHEIEVVEKELKEDFPENEEIIKTYSKKIEEKIGAWCLMATETMLDWDPDEIKELLQEYENNWCNENTLYNEIKHYTY